MPMSTPTNSCKTAYQQADIVAHEQIAEATWRIRVDCPQLASTTRPGQFAMVRLTNRNDPLLARPLAMYDVFPQRQVPEKWQPTALGSDSASGNPQFVDFVYAERLRVQVVLFVPAAAFGHIKVMEVLVKYGVDLNHVAGEFGTALMVAADGKQVRMIRFLLNQP